MQKRIQIQLFGNYSTVDELSWGPYAFRTLDEVAKPALT